MSFDPIPIPADVPKKVPAAPTRPAIVRGMTCTLGGRRFRVSKVTPKSVMLKLIR